MEYPCRVCENRKTLIECDCDRLTEFKRKSGVDLLDEVIHLSRKALESDDREELRDIWGLLFIFHRKIKGEMEKY